MKENEPEIVVVPQPQKSQQKVEESSGNLNFGQYYLKNSTINGVKFIADSDNSFAKTFWSTALIISVIGCVYVLSNSYIKWHYKPDVVSSSSKNNVRNIPFPTVTICPQTKSKTNFVVFENVFRDIFEGSKTHGMPLQESKYFESLLHVCSSQLLKMIKIENGVLDTDRELVQTLKNISYSIENSMLFCKWRSAFVECKDLFTEILTDQGFCYSFNLLNYREVFREDKIHGDFEYDQELNSSWNPSTGYTTNDLNVYPWPIISQEHDALRIILMTTDKDNDYICHGSLQGFKIYFHQSNELPMTFGKHIFVPLEEEASITVAPLMTKASTDLLQYKPEIRNCYQAHERKLEFFKTYSKKNCEVESLANYVLKNCSCVRFSMPRVNFSKICNVQQLLCLTSAERHWVSMTNEGKSKDTKCLPSCTEIQYDVQQLSLSSFDYKTLFDSYSYDLSHIPGAIMSRLTIYFEDSEFETREQYVIFSSMDFLASAGGVLGLFMGFSILSLIEVVFFFLMWLFKIRKNKSAKTSKTFTTVQKLERSKEQTIFVAHF